MLLQLAGLVYVGILEVLVVVSNLKLDFKLVRN